MFTAAPPLAGGVPWPVFVGVVVALVVAAAFVMFLLIWCLRKAHSAADRVGREPSPVELSVRDSTNGVCPSDPVMFFPAKPAQEIEPSDELHQARDSTNGVYPSDPVMFFPEQQPKPQEGIEPSDELHQASSDSD